MLACRLAATLLILALGAACRAQAPGAQAAAPATTELNLDTPAAEVAPAITATLDALNRQGTALQDFTARIRYDATDVRTADTETRDGTVLYNKSAAGPQFAVNFTRYRTSGLAPSPQKLDIVYDGRWLTVVDNARHTFTRNEMAPPGAAYNPLALDGPLPLPIGQKPGDMRARFDITLVPPNPALDPKAESGHDVVHLKLVPYDEKAQGFKQAELWIDRTYNLPIKATRIGLDDNSKTVNLHDIQENTGSVTISVPATPAPGSGWDVTVQRYEEKPHKGAQGLSAPAAK